MRRLIKITLSFIGLATLCLLYGFFIEPKLLKIREVTLAPQNYNGPELRIVLFSDIHIGGLHIPVARVEDIVKRVNALKPDIILIPGDFINGHKLRADHSPAFNADIDNGFAALKNLTAPKGVFASIGNHDVWYDADYVEEALAAANISVLRNQSSNLSNGICIVGLADHDTEQEDKAAFDDCASSTVPIAIMHSPDSFPYLRSDTVLAVAGHTHGGQINLPIIGRRITATASGKKYAYGFVDMNGVPSYVTAGIGTSILSARFRAPPEVVLIELRPY